MKNKKAELTTEQIIGLILAAAGIGLLILLLFSLLPSEFDKKKETAESFLDSFKNEIEKVEDGERGEFQIWNAKKFYLVYFGKTIMYRPTGNYFEVLKAYENQICVCFFDDEKKENICKSCIGLDNPTEFPARQNQFNQWHINENEKISIKKQGDVYLVEIV